MPTHQSERLPARKRPVGVDTQSLSLGRRGSAQRRGTEVSLDAGEFMATAAAGVTAFGRPLPELGSEVRG